MKANPNKIQRWLLLAALLQTVISYGQPVTKVAAGDMHTLFLKGDGSLWVMGMNDNGQLGDGSINAAYAPERIVASGVTAMAGGSSHSLFVKSDGSLWAMGYNAYGQLGDGTYGPSPSHSTNLPEQVVASGVTAVAAGLFHSLFLKSDGSLWGMGRNNAGQLGIGNYTDTNRPVQIVPSGVTAIATLSYSSHSLFLKSDGSLWAMGANGQGQLGNGTYSNTNRPQQIVESNVTAIAAGSMHSLFRKSDGSLWGLGTIGYYYTNRPQLIVVSNVTAIAAGANHSLFGMSDGSLWAWGADNYGQLGDDRTTSSVYYPERIVWPYGSMPMVTAVAGGYWHSLFITADGALWGMGYGWYGQLDGITYPNAYIDHPMGMVSGVSGYNNNLISCQLLNNGDVRLSYSGIAAANYALERSFTVSPANWVSIATNAADAYGKVVLTITPNQATNNFWRFRSVP